MISLKFQGWFECRLAVDPDPADETRGVSGSTRSLAGEPDLDRIIRFHNPRIRRTHTDIQQVGVKITKVAADNEIIEGHPLLHSDFNLEGEPSFFGNNGIVGDDGEEPILPLIVSISNGHGKLQRAVSDSPPQFPFNDYKPNSVIRGSAGPTGGFITETSDVCEQTQIYNIDAVIRERTIALEKDLPHTKDSIEKYNIQYRINFLKSYPFKRDFGARMHWNVELGGAPHNFFDFLDIPNNAQKWRLNFWMGAWDADSLRGYVSGLLQLPGCTFK